MDALKAIDWSKVRKSLMIGIAGVVLTAIAGIVLPSLAATGSPFWMTLTPVFSTTVATILKVLEGMQSGKA